MLMLTIMYTAT